MKKLNFLLIPFIFFIACNSNPKSEKADKSNLKMVVLEIDVEGMTCEGCENTVNSKLSELPGVGDVSASHLQKQVIVYVDTNVTKLAEIEDNIDKIGYTVIK